MSVCWLTCPLPGVPIRVFWASDDTARLTARLTKPHAHFHPRQGFNAAHLTWNFWLLKTFFFFFTFICIYFLWHLFPGHKFLFLQFLLGYLFLLCNLLFWFRNNLFFFSKDHFNVAGRAHVGVDPTVSSVKSCAASWGLCSLGCAQWPENLHLSP